MKKNKLLSEFIKNSILFLIGSLFSKILNFILLPIYTSKIPTDDFGTYDITTMMISLISSVLYFEIWSAMLRYLYDFEDRDKPMVIKSSFIIFLSSTVIFTTASVAFCSLYNIEYMQLVVAWGILTALSTYMSFMARGMGRNIDFATSGIVNTSICLITNIFLILVMDFDYSALYLGSIAGALAQTLYLSLRLKVVKKCIRTQLDIMLIKELLRYSLPLCLNTASYWLLHSSSRLVYNLIYGNSASGIFSVGNKFSTIIVLATTCFTYAWQDLSFSESKDTSNTHLYSIASKKYLLFLCCCLTVTLPILKIIFPIIVKGNYVEAMQYLPLFLIVSVASGYSAFIGNIFYAIKNTKIISLSTIISGAITVLLAFVLIPQSGANGANSAVLLGFLINIIIRFVILNKKINFKIPYINIFICTVWIFATTILYNILNKQLNLILFAVNFVVCLIVFRKDIANILKR